MELNKIYQEDCLELLKKLPTNSVDLVLTDPPYNIKKDSWDDIEYRTINKIINMKKKGKHLNTSRLPYNCS